MIGAHRGAAIGCADDAEAEPNSGGRRARAPRPARVDQPLRDQRRPAGRRDARAPHHLHGRGADAAARHRGQPAGRAADAAADRRADVHHHPTHLPEGSPSLSGRRAAERRGAGRTHPAVDGQQGPARHLSADRRRGAGAGHPRRDRSPQGRRHREGRHRRAPEGPVDGRCHRDRLGPRAPGQTASSGCSARRRSAHVALVALVVVRSGVVVRGAERQGRRERDDDQPRRRAWPARSADDADGRPPGAGSDHREPSRSSNRCGRRRRARRR